MYEELVKRLRNCTSDTVEDCAGCPYQGGYKGTYCMNGLIEEAADAIEELEKAVPRWVSVTERLPEEAYACLAIVWDNNPHTGDMFLNYYPEFVGYGGGSWNDYSGDEIPLDVVYWMKLPQIPEPPKEET